MRQAIDSDQAPQAIGPYSHAVRAVGELVFVSGQLGIDPATGRLAEGIRDETRQALANIRNILAAAGTGLDQVVKTTVLLKDIRDFAAMNEAYAEFFASECPARSAFQAAALPKGASVEIEAIAVSR